jgi:hypothetical protein
MNTKPWFAVLLVALGLSGCAIRNLPKTFAETQTSYSYIPLDPLPVVIVPAFDCYSDENPQKKLIGTPKPLLDSLPDQSVRIATGQYYASGTLVYGPAKIGYSGHSYQVVLDYVNVDTTNVSVYIERKLPDGKLVSVFDNTIKEPTTYRVHRDPESTAFAYLEDSLHQNPVGESAAKTTPKQVPNGDPVVIPVYVGVGLRLTASVTVTKGTANLSSLGAISADAAAGKLTGSLVVQTLGITGKSVSTTLPLPSELNQTTIQNAILALGAIKAVLYDPTTQIDPRVVGIYNPVGGGQQLVNGIISVLASNPLRWFRPCADASKTSAFRTKDTILFREGLVSPAEI